MSQNDCIGKTLKPWPILVDHYSTQHSELRQCLDQYISEHDNRRLDIKAEMLAVENAIAFYKDMSQVAESRG
ncbi:hypothetical protein BJL83_24215 [Vibrio parahaemolyticus]|nr:hypothetical protein BJL83_24215 [Vibrio parahaemolyticus]